VFELAITMIRASAFSAAHLETGETHSSCSSPACLKYVAAWPSIATLTIGFPPALSTSSYTAWSSGWAATSPSIRHASPRLISVE
jgi:hypothetical protein